MDLEIEPVKEPVQESVKEPEITWNSLSDSDKLLSFAIFGRTKELPAFLEGVPRDFTLLKNIKSCLDYYTLDYKISQPFFNRVYKETASDARWHTWKYLYDYYISLETELRNNKK